MIRRAEVTRRPMARKLAVDAPEDAALRYETVNMRDIPVREHHVTANYPLEICFGSDVGHTTHNGVTRQVWSGNQTWVSASLFPYNCCPNLVPGQRRSRAATRRRLTARPACCSDATPMSCGPGSAAAAATPRCRRRQCRGATTPGGRGCSSRRSE